MFPCVQYFITAEILAHSLANFHCQYVDRHIRESSFNMTGGNEEIEGEGSKNF